MANMTQTAEAPSMELVESGAVEKFSECWVNRDYAGFADLYTKDAVLLPAGDRDIVKGRENAVKYLEDTFGNSEAKSWKGTTLGMIPAGHKIIRYGKYKLFKEDGAELGQGKSVEVWVKDEDGKPKMMLDIWNVC